MRHKIKKADKGNQKEKTNLKKEIEDELRIKLLLTGTAPFCHN